MMNIYEHLNLAKETLENMEEYLEEDSRTTAATQLAVVALALESYARHFDLKVPVHRDICRTIHTKQDPVVASVKA